MAEEGGRSRSTCWGIPGIRSHAVAELPGLIEKLHFYHAVEHLGKIAALQRRWTAAKRQAWIGRQRRRLLKGGAEEVRAAIDAVCGSRPGKALKREARILQGSSCVSGGYSKMHEGRV